MPATRMMTYLGLGLWFLASSTPALAAPSLAESVQAGKKLFMTEHFVGNGRTCNTCHRGGGKDEGKLPNGKAIPSLANAGAIFPRYSKGAHMVITLPQQVHRCVMGALRGMPPAYDSAAMTDLVAYITSLAQGKAIDMGGDPK